MAPGMYRVRMTATKGSVAPLPVTFDFRMLPDPRAEATEADLKEQVRLALVVRDKITQANEGVIESRHLKSELDDRKAKMTADATFGPLAASFAAELGIVEDSLYQTKNQSGQDPLNFPIRLNDQLGGLMGFIMSGERRPPKQAYDVWTVLAPKTDGELAKMERVITTVDRHANTSAASVPLALDEAVRDGRIKPGQHVMLEGVGGGFTWGAVLIKW